MGSRFRKPNNTSKYFKTKDVKARVSVCHETKTFDHGRETPHVFNCLITWSTSFEVTLPIMVVDSLFCLIIEFTIYEIISES
ncbi:MAG: hypothetical protein WKF36_01115 [Candidatus Nitrosocosmicus sp.]